MFRLSSAALHLRTLDAFRATLLLARDLLDADARAHLRIGFDHMVAFAWVIAEPSDVSRPRRIATHGFALAAKQTAELLPYGIKSIGGPRAPGTVLGADDLVAPLPNIRELCAELDEIWHPRLGGFRIPDAPFAFWHSYLYRGASAFVHPSAGGIEPLRVADGDAYLVGPATTVRYALLDTLARLTRVQIAMASFATPWLVEGRHLHDL